MHSHFSYMLNSALTLAERTVNRWFRWFVRAVKLSGERQRKAHGMHCKLAPDCYLWMSERLSCPYRSHDGRRAIRALSATESCNSPSTLRPLSWIWILRLDIRRATYTVFGVFELNIGIFSFTLCFYAGLGSFLNNSPLIRLHLSRQLTAHQVQ